MRDIATAPLDRYIILFGPSGYVTTPFRAEIGCWSGDRQAWVDHANNRFTDGGEDPTHWIDVPSPTPTRISSSLRSVAISRSEAEMLTALLFLEQSSEAEDLSDAIRVRFGMASQVEELRAREKTQSKFRRELAEEILNEKSV